MKTFVDEIPETIINDDNFLYHGTSNISEKTIDNVDYQQFCHFSTAEIVSVLTIYKTINWDGLSSGGYPVLNTYSISDFNNDTKPLFLGYEYNRCLFYASKDNAGGELTRSVYYAIKDLKDYIENENIRIEHKKYVDDNFIYYRTNYNVDLEMLKKEVSNLNNIYKKAIDIRNSFEYGIIYCFKITPNLYDIINDRNSMGFTANLNDISNNFYAKIIVGEKLMQHPIGNFLNKTTIQKMLLWKDRLLQK